MKIAFIIDPFSQLKIDSDTSYMLMLSANKKNYKQVIFRINDIFLENFIPKGIGKKITIINNYIVMEENSKIYDLNNFNMIFIRKDPPVDLNFLYLTYILEIVEKNNKTLIINSPKALRDNNEKIMANKYKLFVAPNIISNNIKNIKAFIKIHQDVIVKPLNMMGGEKIYRIKYKENNENVILENMTQYNKDFIITQKYLPEIKFGDNRIFIINGITIEHVVSRIPNLKDNRGNASRGAIAYVRKINKHEKLIGTTISQYLKKQNIFFAGIDVIGKYITEINITSPTLAKNILIEKKYDITMQLLENLEQILKDKGIYV